MKTCIYCDMDLSCGLATEHIMRDKEINLGIIKNINLNLILQDGDDLCVFFMNQDNDIIQEFSTKIQYCPICGRKLKNEEEEE